MEKKPYEYIGFLDIDRVAGGKRLQGVWLTKDNGRKLVISYRPQERFFPFVEKRVRIIGSTRWPDSSRQALQMTHLDVEKIELAPGETPHDPVPDTLLEPPNVDSIDEASRRTDLWVTVVGELVEFRESCNPLFPDAIVRLKSGEDLVCGWARKVDWEEYLGKSFKVVGIIGIHKDTLAISMGGPYAIGNAEDSLVNRRISKKSTMKRK
jgi:hypothetical protein